uniref:Uncharacterized protein n=2 Tax=Aegilops tauschii subsp. strangulata TaxID=200361 RepID=A0A453AC16_AEGTS
MRLLHFVGTFQCHLHQEMNHLLQGRHCFQGHLPRISFRCYLLVCSIVFMHFLPCLLSPPAECTCKQQDSFCFVLLLFQIQVLSRATFCSLLPFFVTLYMMSNCRSAVKSMIPAVIHFNLSTS